MIGTRESGRSPRQRPLSGSAKAKQDSAPILRKKLASIKNTGAPIVAMDCPGCVMQIRGGLDRQGSAVTVKHTVELLAERLE